MPNASEANVRTNFGKCLTVGMVRERKMSSVLRSSSLEREKGNAGTPGRRGDRRRQRTGIRIGRRGRETQIAFEDLEGRDEVTDERLQT